MERCIHGIEKDWCGICNGSNDRAENEVRLYKANKVAKAKFNKERKELQERSKGFATNHKEAFSDEDLVSILENTKGVAKEDINVLFLLAQETKRRLGAIEWIWNYAWDEEFEEYDVRGKDCNLYKRINELKAVLV